MAALDVRAVSAEGLPREPSPPIRQGFRIFLSEECFDRATARGQADPSREVGGVLVGQVCCDDTGPYVRVDATVDALHAEEKGAELTFTHATWDHIHAEIDRQHQGRRIVGWYHTHPGFGIFLSDRDQFIHQSFFNLPFQVALVIDPKSRQHGVFAWQDNEPLRARRYWIGAAEQVWDGPRSAAAPPKAPPEEAPLPAERRESGPWREHDWPNLALVGVVLLLLGGLAGSWIGRWWMRDQVLQEAVRALNTDVLGFLRQLVDERGIGPRLDAALLDLERAEASLRGEGATRPAEPLAEGLRKLRSLRDERARAAEVLALLARYRPVDLDRLERNLASVRAALGQFFWETAEDAAKARDLERAARLLRDGASVDLENAERYLKRRESLEKELPR